MGFLQTIRDFGAACPWPVRALGRGYLSFGKIFSEFVTFGIMSVIYWACLPFFTVMKFSDPLHYADTGAKSYWDAKIPMAQTLDRYTRPF